MIRFMLCLCLVASALTVEAAPRRRYTYTTTPTTSSMPVSGYTSTSSMPTYTGNTGSAQGVAEIQASRGYVGHFGGNSGYEGCGSGSTPEQALNNCCYSNSGMAVVDQGVACGRNGRWYASKRYR
jgi:hypothetical protein